MGKLAPYVADTETTSLELDGDIIELSLLRVSDGEQQTWFFKAMNEAAITQEALEVNGHKLEDITWKTEEGKKKYRLPAEVLPEIENWLSDGDGVSLLDRILVGHNITFDQARLELLWKRCNAEETYPFGRNTIDTKALAVFFDWIQDSNSRTYNLGKVVKRLGLAKRKFHGAAEDVLATHDLIQFFFNFFSTLIDKSETLLPLLGEEIEDEVKENEEEEEFSSSYIEEEEEN